MLEVEVSVGELIDKLSILQVKKNKITQESKLVEVEKEYNILQSKANYYFQNEEILNMFNKLTTVNEKLWDVEDLLRKHEKNQNFDNEFIELARLVYYTNDERFSIKNEINKMTNSNIREQKSYEEYSTKKTFIYESPDNGKTVYRREFGKAHNTRERLK
jgi:hypothetical protein